MKNEPNRPPNGDRAAFPGTSPVLRLRKQSFSKNSRPAGSTPLVQQMPGIHHIELSLRDVDQLFNTMDPSPFHEKDLDDDAAEFILSWAQEFHRHEPVDLIVHLEKHPEGHNAQQLVEDAVHNYFAYCARLNELEFKRLMKQGRMSLLVGLSFLVLCFLIIELLALSKLNTFPSFLKEGLTIAGWVAMWRPLEIYLYEWWPLRRRGQIFNKLSRMPVEVRKRM
jgi:hypothetical protein